MMAVGNQSGASRVPKRVSSSENKVKIKVTRPRQTSRNKGCGVVTKTRWYCLFITALSRDAMPSGKKMSERVNLIIWFMLVQTIYNSYGDRSEFDTTDLLNRSSVKKNG